MATLEDKLEKLSSQILALVHKTEKLQAENTRLRELVGKAWDAGAGHKWLRHSENPIKSKSEWMKENKV